MPCGCMSLRSAVIVIGSAVFREVGVLHAAGFVESAVEFEGCLQGDGSLAAFAHLKIVEEQRAIDRVSAVVDDLVGAFDRILVTEIGDALVGHEDIDRVFAVVGMGHHRHDVADQAAFRHRRTAEDRDIGVAGEVARAADAVHHLGAEHVGRVD